MNQHAVVTALAALIVPQIAAADPPGLVPSDAPPNPAVASPLEPGTLALGQLGVRAGVGLGNGPLGIGGELAVGLGGVDVLASLGYLPRFCVNLGNFGSGCDPAKVLPGVGVQVKLGQDGPIRFGARAHADHAIAGHAVTMAVGGLSASGGTSSVRLSLGVTTAYWYEPSNLSKENGLYVGPEAAIQFLKERGGFALTAGFGFPIDHQSQMMPLASATAVWR